MLWDFAFYYACYTMNMISISYKFVSSAFAYFRIVSATMAKSIAWWSLACAHIVVILVGSRRFADQLLLLASGETNGMCCCSTKTCFIRCGIRGWSWRFSARFWCSRIDARAKRIRRCTLQTQIMIMITKYRRQMVTCWTWTASFHLYIFVVILTAFTNNFVTK